VFKIKFNLNAIKKYKGELTKFHVVVLPNLNFEADILCIIYNYLKADFKTL